MSLFAKHYKVQGLEKLLCDFLFNLVFLLHDDDDVTVSWYKLSSTRAVG